MGISPFDVSAAVSPKNRYQDVRVLCPKPYMLACRASGGSPRSPGAQTSTRETALAASEAGAAATGALAGRTGQAAQVCRAGAYIEPYDCGFGGFCAPCCKHAYALRQSHGVVHWIRLDGIFVQIGKSAGPYCEWQDCFLIQFCSAPISFVTSKRYIPHSGPNSCAARGPQRASLARPAIRMPNSTCPIPCLSPPPRASSFDLTAIVFWEQPLGLGSTLRKATVATKLLMQW